jgi:hypothetical protein
VGHDGSSRQDAIEPRARVTRFRIGGLIAPVSLHVLEYHVRLD